MAKKKYVLVDAQEDRKLELHVAFYGNDNEDQILCELSEKSVVELVHKYNQHILNDDFGIDVDVIRYINEKFFSG